jgi:hypothetical protein
MIYRGHVQNGVVILEEGAKLPDGLQVKVEPVETRARSDEQHATTLYERFKDIIGKVSDLPTDMAAQHDHYIHGTPKQ